LRFIEPAPDNDLLRENAARSCRAQPGSGVGHAVAEVALILISEGLARNRRCSVTQQVGADFGKDHAQTKK
jgi:hypothetical protein